MYRSIFKSKSFPERQVAVTGGKDVEEDRRRKVDGSITLNHSMVDVDAIARSLEPSTRGLLTRYLSNALKNPDRRSIRAGNARFSALVTSAPEALQILAAAGFAATEEAGELHYTLSGADTSLRAVLEVLEAHATSLLSLPGDLLDRVLGDLSAEDLSALQRSSKIARPIASAGRLWLRFCPPRFWREAKEAGIDRGVNVRGWAKAAPIGFSCFGGANSTCSSSPPRSSSASSATPPHVLQSLIDWRLVYRHTALWERLRSRCGTDVVFSLREGLRIDALTALHPAVLHALSPSVLASLMVHDGQIDGSVERIGMLFAGARLLSLEEIANTDAARQIVASGATAVDVTDSAGGAAPTTASSSSSPSMADGTLLPLTTTVGFQHLAVRVGDGAICMSAGFNTHVKARDWPTFLERVLWDTI